MDKRSVLHFLGLAALMLTSVALLLCAYLGLAWHRDPLHLFQKSTAPAYLIGNMRIQAAGIINTFDFDSVILGTSMLENSSAKELSITLGGNFANISVSGSSFYERSLILEHALKKKNLKKVVYSIDSYYLYCTFASYPEKNWAYLYDNSFFNDFKAYLNILQMKDVLFNIRQGKKKSLDRPGAWFKNKYHACRFGGLDNWVKYRDKQGVGKFLGKQVPEAARKAKAGSAVIVRDQALEQKAREYVEKYVLSMAEKHPETTFYYVFPPYWRYFYAEMLQTDSRKFATHQEVIRHVVRCAQELGNIHVFGFEDCDFVDDIANYKDVTHYSEKINQYIASSMSKKEHLLTSANVEGYLSRCEKLARDFDLQKLAELVEEKLAKVQKR